MVKRAKKKPAKKPALPKSVKAVGFTRVIGGAERNIKLMSGVLITIRIETEKLQDIKSIPEFVDKLINDAYQNGKLAGEKGKAIYSMEGDYNKMVESRDSLRRKSEDLSRMIDEAKKALGVEGYDDDY